MLHGGSYPIPQAKNLDQAINRVKCDGILIGGYRHIGTSDADRDAAMRHDGVVIGGSVTSGKAVANPASIDRLPGPTHI